MIAGALLEFAAAAACGDLGAARRALGRARRQRTSRRAAEEVALMLVLYAGFPAALEATRLVAELWPGRARRSREGGPSRWRRRGEALCRRVYGPVYSRLIAHARQLHPDLAVWMVEEGYGRVLSRPGLAARERERVAVTVLAALGWERQLVSHLLGARRLGARARDVRRSFEIGRKRAAATAPADRAWAKAALAPLDSR